MARTRRQQLARALSDATDLGYQQALTWVAGYVAGTGHLPRSTQALLSAYVDAGKQDVDVELVEASSVVAVRIFTIRSSDVGRCPVSSLSVAHYLPTGVCAHAAPPCPTCGGAGKVLAQDGPVPCAKPALVPGVPVCDGTGVWSGSRA